VTAEACADSWVPGKKTWDMPNIWVIIKQERGRRGTPRRCPKTSQGKGRKDADERKVLKEKDEGSSK